MQTPGQIIVLMRAGNHSVDSEINWTSVVKQAAYSQTAKYLLKKAGFKEYKHDFKIDGRNIKHLDYTVDTNIYMVINLYF